jgi:hypothetical protein
MPLKHWLILALLAASAHATTRIAASCSTADVQTSVTASSEGDTVIVPAGSCTWTSGISVSTPIQIVGASVGNVIITDNDTTSSDSMFVFTTDSTFSPMIANINFLPGTATGHYISVGGSGTKPMLYHDIDTNIPNFQLSNAISINSIGGVMWHVTIESTQNLGGTCGQQIGSDSGSIVVKSPKNWDDADTQGTADTNGNLNFYIENSTLSYVGQIPDVDDNGRVVMRYNTMLNISGGLTHGTTSTYGGRAVEIYNNTFTDNNPKRNVNRYFWWRAGTGTVTQNHFDPLTGGGCYGVKDTLTFAVENAARQDGGHNCCTNYQCFHQPGTGSDGTNGHSNLGAGQAPAEPYQQSLPVYIWDNTGTGQGSAHYGFNDGAPRQCNSINPGTGNPYTTTDFFQSGRDYFFDDSGTSTGAKPGWTAYTYPHPLAVNTAAATPTFSLSGSTLTILTDYGTSTCYTTDSSTPVTNAPNSAGCSHGTSYTIPINGASGTYKAVAGGTGFVDSAVATDTISGSVAINTLWTGGTNITGGISAK